ncbi:hypothetical protein J5N97_025180 [Dioscorea zingiberensis]|uniref:Uncharacterized protein n=1 Tax=Dioscorea zingiberensis TaxID=325984 RepID=A0A9D5C8L5_9LILI|nr:hypothetical protein J5N97_025180 [Dioscorea zingiberensis]
MFQESSASKFTSHKVAVQPSQDNTPGPHIAADIMAILSQDHLHCTCVSTPLFRIYRGYLRRELKGQLSSETKAANGFLEADITASVPFLPALSILQSLHRFFCWNYT